jgi:hypothetical protein
LGYEYDIYVSYRRSDEDWVRWTQEHFVRLVRSLLQPGLGQVRIFVDQDIETGTAWPARLAQAHARSRILVPILCRDYFRSDWCQLELALMHDREKATNLRTVASPWGLIVPVVIDDGDCFPPEVRELQAEKLHEFANPFMRDGSPKQEAFAERLRTRVCPAIQDALGRVPAFDPAWEHVAHDHFIGVFRVQERVQDSVPIMSLAGMP